MLTKSNKIRDGLFLAALLREEFLRHWIGSAVVLTLVVFVVIPSSGQQNLFAKVRALVEEKNYSGAEKALTQMKGPLSPADIALSSFVRGVLSFELQKYNEAQSHLEKALTIPSPIEYYVRYFLGLSFQAKREFKEAQREYDRLLKLRPPSQLAYEAKFKISEMLIDQGKWSKALPELAYLERRWRSSEAYPEILWRLVKVEMQSGRKWRACAWARRLYSKYPQHGLIDDWGIDLPSSPFEGKKLGCLATQGDQQKRIRRLQWAGKSDRARSELETLKKRATGEAPLYAVDMALANFLVNDGYVDEALKLLIKHYEKYQRNFAYLMQLGRAAARAGEYQTAVGAFYRAHESSPKSRSGREALYQAAFLSYQFQDYDGASRKFEQFLKEYPRSGLSRDSQWHMSWIRYLKGDYLGALNGFDRILNEKKNRQTRRYWNKIAIERINYWKAMALLRMNKYTEARSLFEALAKDPMWDYYTLTAKYRLESISNLETVRKVAEGSSSNYLGIMPDGDGLVSLKEELDVNGEIIGKQEGEGVQEAESEEGLNTTLDGVSAEEEEVPDVVATEEGTSSPDEEKAVVATDFRDPELRLRFERATLLIQVGLGEWARWELFEIERRTRNQDYLKMLMASYEQIRSYHRSSYISIVNFSNIRSQRGIEGSRYLWEYAYPRAYKDSVEKYAISFNVPSEFIWGIMRTESSFRFDVVSPVGAKGLMQLMPNTAKQVARLIGDETFNERRLSDPDLNLRLGTKYLQRLLSKFGGSVPLAAASYNAGPHRVEGWLANFGKLEMDEFIEHIPFIETRNYVKKVVRDFGIYESLYAKATTKLTWLVQPIKVEVTRPSQRETWETL